MFKTNASTGAMFHSSTINKVKTYKIHLFYYNIVKKVKHTYIVQECKTQNQRMAHISERNKESDKDRKNKRED